MVAGGLAGSTPHMISATITAISRLVFEFKGKSCYEFLFRMSAQIEHRCVVKHDEE